MVPRGNIDLAARCPRRAQRAGIPGVPVGLRLILDGTVVRVRLDRFSLIRSSNSLSSEKSALALHLHQVGRRTSPPSC